MMLQKGVIQKEPLHNSGLILLYLFRFRLMMLQKGATRNEPLHNSGLIIFIRLFQEVIIILLHLFHRHIKILDQADYS